MAGCLEGSKVAFAQHVAAGGIVGAVDGAVLGVEVGHGDEVLAVLVRHLVPVPPGDDIVQTVGLVLVVHPYLIHQFAVGILDAANLHLLRLVGRVRHIVGVEVGLHIEQLQAAVRGGGDGQRQVYGLRVGIGRAGVGRYLLIVDVDGALHVPVVGLGVVGIGELVGVVRGVAVVDDGLCGMDEVAGGLPFHLVVQV